METGASFTPVAKAGINSCVCVDDRVWVDMGATEGARGGCSIPTQERSKYTGKALVVACVKRQAPVLACAVVPANEGASVSSVGPDLYSTVGSIQ